MSATPFPILPSRTLQDLGERVALARRARGLTQRDLAHLAGVGASSIVALEKGHPGVAVGTLARALDALGLLAEMDGLLAPQRDPALTAFAAQQLRRPR
jgi:transcriptional regulator with XRE-family HTH domain